MSKIYIIILNYQTFEDTIRLTHELLLQNNISPHIVIVDNNSPNKSYEKLKSEFNDFKQIEILKNNINNGYSLGNNLGLKYISKYKPQIVSVLNNDIHLSNRNLFYSLLQELYKYSNAYFVAPSMILDGKEKFSAWKIPTIKSDLRKAILLIKKLTGDPDSYEFPIKRKTEIVECLTGSFLLGYYGKFERLGFFDENLFLFGEETILAYKIKEAEGINLLCRQLNFEHAWSKTINKNMNRIQRIKLQNYGKVYFHTKYLKTSGFLIFIFKILLNIRLLEEYILMLFRRLKII